MLQAQWILNFEKVNIQKKAISVAVKIREETAIKTISKGSFVGSQRQYAFSQEEKSEYQRREAARV